MYMYMLRRRSPARPSTGAPEHPRARDAAQASGVWAPTRPASTRRRRRAA